MILDIKQYPGNGISHGHTQKLCKEIVEWSLYTQIVVGFETIMITLRALSKEEICAEKIKSVNEPAKQQDKIFLFRVERREVHTNISMWWWIWKRQCPQEIEGSGINFPTSLVSALHTPYRQLAIWM